MNYQALRGFLEGRGGLSSAMMMSFSSMRRILSDLRLLRLEERWMVGSTSFLVILPVLATLATFSLFFSSQQDLFSAILSTECSSNLCFGSRSLMFLKSFLRGGRIFSRSSFRVIVLLLFMVVSDNSLPTPSPRRRSRSFSSSSVAEGRSLGSVLRQSRMRFSRSSEQAVGMRLQTPLMMVFLSDLRSWLTKGGFRAAISQSTQPSDHTSHLLLQGFSCHTSGLAQQGVPVCVRAIPLAVTIDTFMSANLTCVWSLVRKMLADLMSRWRTLTAWRAQRPRRACWATRQMRASSTMRRLTLARVMSWKMSPPSRHSVTMQKQLLSSSKKESRQARMQGLERLARMRTSLRQLATSFSDSEAIRIFFSAYSFPSYLRFTRQTVEKAPSPSFDTTVY